MKYGNFVAENNVAINENEKAQFIAHFVNLVQNAKLFVNLHFVDALYDLRKVLWII